MTNSVQYAEQHLQVNSVYTEALTLEAEYGELVEKVKVINDLLREVEDNLEERERSIAATLMADKDYVQLSKTALREAIKHDIDNNEEVIDLRRQIAVLKGDRASFEYDMKIRTQGIALRVARMTELGGLLNFYAAAKASQPQVQHVTSQGVNQS